MGCCTSRPLTNDDEDLNDLPRKGRKRNKRSVKRPPTGQPSASFSQPANDTGVVPEGLQAAGDLVAEDPAVVERRQAAESVPAKLRPEEVKEAANNYIDAAIVPSFELLPDPSLYELVCLEEMYMNYARQAEEYQAKIIEEDVLVSRELELLFEGTLPLLSVQQSIMKSLSNIVEQSQTLAGLSWSLDVVTTTYWRLGDTFKLQALKWLERRSYCETLTSSHPEMVQLMERCEKEEMLHPLEMILNIPLERVATYCEIFSRLQEMAASVSLKQEESSLRETMMAMQAVNDELSQVDYLASRFEEQWNTALMIHGVKSPRLVSSVMSLSYYDTVKWELVPSDVSTYFHRKGNYLNDWVVDLFLFDTVLIATCDVDELGSQFFGYVYPLSHVAISSVHLRDNVWTLYRYDRKGECELTLRSSSQEEKWKMINFIHQKASENVQNVLEEMKGGGGGDVSTAASLSSVWCRRQLRFLMKELVDTEMTYVKSLDMLMYTYLLPLCAETLLSSTELDIICSNLEHIVVHQHVFLKALQTTVYRRCTVRESLKSISKLFNDNMEHFKIYADYIVNLSQSNDILLKYHYKLDSFLTRQNPSQQHANSLHSLLISPFQRLLRYPLLLKSAINCAKKETGWEDELWLLERTVNSMEEICHEANERKKLMDGCS